MKMLFGGFLVLGGAAWGVPGAAGEEVPAFPVDPLAVEERTSFQTSKAWSPLGNLRSDVAMVYGIDAGLPERLKTWQARGYRTHVMTGVSWGQYQDYLYGRFDGVNHEDNAQTDRFGKKISHGGDVYYMCPAENFGQYLCVGVQRALDAGAEAIHLEEPEFWDRAGYSEGFKREWQAYYKEPWQAPHSSVDARWRASKLKYYLYRRALQQVFSYVQASNQKTGRQVRCYVPTHSLINYAQWCIVSPESSLAQLEGCDGYIAQVWTGTSRSPNRSRGEVKERTFETAFLEYGAMYNMVRSTGRRVWFLNDPIEDNPDHDWVDYQKNWESTLVASLLHPEVSQYEVAPWPERIFGEKYPRQLPQEQRHAIPPAYATELQTVMHALAEMKQPNVQWDCGTRGIGVLISDSLMFQRGEPTPSDPHLSNFYGLAMPLVKRGLPVTPVQLENVPLRDYLKAFRVLLLTYQGQKPLSPGVHAPLVQWVKDGGVLIFVDDDRDPYLQVREWWNTGGLHYSTPRHHLFAALGWAPPAAGQELAPQKIGQGAVMLVPESPVRFAGSLEADQRLAEMVRRAAALAGLTWQETNHLVLRRGPWLIAAGLEDSIGAPSTVLTGRLINLFDPALALQTRIEVKPAARFLLLDLDAVKPLTPPVPRVLASACKALPVPGEPGQAWTVEGVGDTPAIVLLSCPQAPRKVTLEGTPDPLFEYDGPSQLLRIRFLNTAGPRRLALEF